MRQLTVPGFLLILMMLTSSAAAQGDLRAAIEAANRSFVAAFAKGDAAGVAGAYTTDAEAFPPNADVIRGRAEIQKFWGSVIASGIASAKLTTHEVVGSGDLAYETGTYELATKDGKLADRGKYLVVWKRAGGKWMLHRDIWNTSQPAQQH